jgi:hypothetical protein
VKGAEAVAISGLVSEPNNGLRLRLPPPTGRRKPRLLDLTPRERLAGLSADRERLQQLLPSQSRADDASRPQQGPRPLLWQPTARGPRASKGNGNFRTHRLYHSPDGLAGCPGAGAALPRSGGRRSGPAPSVRRRQRRNSQTPAGSGAH